MMKIKWGVLGNAGIARNFVIPGMQAGKFSEVAAIASRDINKSKKTAKALGIEKAYGSYEELLADKSIDAVYIPLPNHLHVEWSIKAMKAGKHVLCEKPFALTVAEVKHAMGVRDQSGVKMGEAFMVRTHPQWLKAKELTSSEDFGKLRAVQGFFSYSNFDSSNIRNSYSSDMGGGGLWDIGCYPVNTSRFLFREEPTRVIAIAEFDPNFKTDILASAILDFPSGQATFISSTQISPYQRMLAVGTKKHVEIKIPFNSPSTFPTELYYDDSNVNEAERNHITIDTCNQYTLEGDAFSKAIIENIEVPVPLEDTIYNTAILTALYKSAKSGKWENVTI
ncbi:MAG: Gfo/Idh/MocA family oxidoreductase [Spirochaetaceae bacterium]|nr:Gfo/Idh/MocA family oxidoreductase [Spirochaetaceae bacterium]